MKFCRTTFPPSPFYCLKTHINPPDRRKKSTPSQGHSPASSFIQNLDLFQSSHTAQPQGSLVRHSWLRKPAMFLDEGRQLLHTLVKDLLMENDGGANGTEHCCRSCLCGILDNHPFWMANMVGPCPYHPISTKDMGVKLAQTLCLHPSAPTAKVAPKTIQQLRRNIAPFHAIQSASAVIEVMHNPTAV